MNSKVAHESVVAAPDLHPIKASAFKVSRFGIWLALPLVAIIAAVACKVSIYAATATLAYMLLIFGLINRANRPMHVRLMGTAMALDLLVVLLLELNRGAIETVVAGDLKILQGGHIAASSTALLLYFAVAALGITQLNGKGSPKSRKLHMSLGLTAFAFRTIGFILMYSVVGLSK